MTDGGDGHKGQDGRVKLGRHAGQGVRTGDLVTDGVTDTRDRVVVSNWAATLAKVSVLETW